MKKIALVTNRDKDENFNIAKSAIDVLIKSGAEVFVSDKDKELTNTGAVLCPGDEMYDKAECVLVYGGDGTIMRISHKASTRKLPLLGVNMGRVGYLAELEPYETELLKSLVNDEYTVEYRMMLEAVLTTKDGNSQSVAALNDIVLSKGELSVMSEMEAECNGNKIGKYFADGLVIATPTGSTAYSLAAGGPVVDTAMSCICLTPICPQSFYAKPIIFDGDSTLTFKKGARGRGRLFLTADGGSNTELCDGDILTVKKSENSLILLHIKNNNFCNILHGKMSDIV